MAFFKIQFALRHVPVSSFRGYFGLSSRWTIMNTLWYIPSYVGYPIENLARTLPGITHRTSSENSFKIHMRCHSRIPLRIVAHTHFYRNFSKDTSTNSCKESSIDSSSLFPRGSSMNPTRVCITNFSKINFIIEKKIKVFLRAFPKIFQDFFRRHLQVFFRKFLQEVFQEIFR